jgi:SAM-dependent methyltransferase
MAKTSGFQLSGTGPESYEVCWVPALMGKCAEDLAAAANICPGDRVLDVGCGTGVVAREAARQTGTASNVTGTDINEGMLEIARSFAERHELSEIAWRQCDAASMPFDDGAFDVVLCQQGLQFMPDRSAATAEMARVLAPGGRLVVSVWRSSSAFGIALCEALDRQFGEGTTAPWQIAYSLGDRHELRALATNAGLRNAQVHFDVKMACHSHPEEFVLGAIAGSPLADGFADLADGQRADIVREIVSALDDCRDDNGLAVPAECHTLTAEKT